MLFDFATAGGGAAAASDAGLGADARPRWGVDSEYGRLTDVLLSAPPHLEVLPCNAVAVEALANGLACCPVTAETQHQALARALEAAGVRCHFVPPAEPMPDLSFTRDAALMTPWGLLELRPAVAHRRAEAAHVRRTAERWGIPILGRLGEGRVEGGDVCLLRPGVAIVGYSGERTDRAGAGALARLFEARGWHVIRYRFDPHFLHLDTHFTIVDRHRAVACVDFLEPGFRAELAALGIDLVPVTYDEVQRLGGNILSLGDGRLLSSADNRRLNQELERLGYTVIPVGIDQFVRCGGGVHCLTLPLSRVAG
ncbi:MAG TPA: arginine deiminase family protein [Allosphingosinicella sp.]|nr:arginine deiminase family protein [Allosphingosinicella sp.]